MTENIITVALVAIATVSAVTLFGNNIRSLFGVSADGLAGENRVKNRASRSGPRAESRTLKTFAGGVDGDGAGPNGETK